VRVNNGRSDLAVDRRDRAELWRAFDRLPRDIRDMLNYAPLPVSPTSVLDHARDNGIDSARTALTGMIARVELQHQLSVTEAING